MAWSFHLCLCTAFALVWIGTCEDENCVRESGQLTVSRPDWVENLLPINYSNLLPPPNNGCPTTVSITYMPMAFGEISVLTMTIEVDMYLHISWMDKRLNTPESSSRELVVLKKEEISQVWSPKLRFRNCMHCRQISIDPMTDKMWILNGNLHFSVRAAEKFSCNFNLSAYPIDTQNCFIEVESSGEIKSSVKLTAVMRHVQTIEVTEFKIDNIYERNCTDGFMSKLLSCISYGFVLKRQMTFHLMLTYVPSMLIVILSWFSFWLDADASAPRVTIGLTSLLTLATQFANAQKNLPAVSYVKAIDVWMFVCMFMVFASLLEFAIANNFARLKRMQNVYPVKTVSPFRGPPKFLKKSTTLKLEEGKRVIVDKVAQVLFPASYAIFNFCYWGYYCYILPHNYVAE